MQELVGKLAALDPAASNSLQVIAYFDALIEARSGRLALLRAAARLTGCPAGAQLPGDLVARRVSPEGTNLPAAPAETWPGRRLPGGGRVWLERSGEPSPVDQMVLERLALAASLISPRPTRGGSPSALLVLVDATASVEEREEAAARCHLAPDVPLRAVAAVRDPRRPDERPTVVTSWGEVGLAVLRPGQEWTGGPAGIGLAGPPLDLPASWSSALIALRARRVPDEMSTADELGAVIALVQALDAGATVPDDVRRVEAVRTDPRLAALLDAIVDSTSVRGAAARLALHHSTMQARVDQLTRSLGFDVATPHGRTRLDLALALARVRQAVI